MHNISFSIFFFGCTLQNYLCHGMGVSDPPRHFTNNCIQPPKQSKHVEADARGASDVCKKMQNW